MIDLVLMIGKVLFLVVLYWFVFMVVRSATRDLRAATPSYPGPTPVVGAVPDVGGTGRAGANAGRAVPGPVVLDVAGGGSWALVVVSSPVLQAGSEVGLAAGAALVLGRSESADLVLSDTFVSSRHARVRALPGAVEIEDLGSTNGTFVDGRELDAPVLVGPGDEVAVGDTVFRVEVR